MFSPHLLPVVGGWFTLADGEWYRCFPYVYLLVESEVAGCIGVHSLACQLSPYCSESQDLTIASQILTILFFVLNCDMSSRGWNSRSIGKPAPMHHLVESEEQICSQVLY